MDAFAFHPRITRHSAFAVLLFAQSFYLLTLAPTVLWGDDAMYQRRAASMDFQNQEPWDHPIWVLLSQPFVRLPVGSPAFKANLFTSFCAALTVAVAFALVRNLTGGRLPALLSCLSLMVSHTFWTHAVRTEVYSLNLLGLALALYLITHPRLTILRTVGSAIATGVAVSNHVMMILCLPGYLLLVLQRLASRDTTVFRSILSVVALAAVYSLGRLAFPPHYSVSFNPQTYLVSAQALVHELMFVIAYVLLQFPSPAILLVLGGLFAIWRRPLFAIALLSMAIANVFPFVAHSVPDKYVFFNILYFVLSILVGIGAAAIVPWLVRRFPKIRKALPILLVAATVVFPLCAYYSAPRLLPRVGITADQLHIRSIPHRPALDYFLWPSKHGYQGARLFVEERLPFLPESSMLIADHTLLQPMLYVQRIEGVRRDIEIVEVRASEQVAFARDAVRTHRLFLAMTEPYYDIRGLEEEFDVVPYEGVFELVRRPR